jgi:hypothetical protein
MPYPVVLGAMLCDAPRDGLRCRMMPYNATWCFAMPHNVPQYSAWGAAMPALVCPALHAVLYAMLHAMLHACDALQCHMALCDAM